MIYFLPETIGSGIVKCFGYSNQGSDPVRIGIWDAENGKIDYQRDEYDLIEYLGDEIKYDEEEPKYV